MSLAKRRNRPQKNQSPFEEPILDVEPNSSKPAKAKARKVKQKAAGKPRQE